MPQITTPSRQLFPVLGSRVVSSRQLSPTLEILLTSDSNFSNNTLGQFNSNIIAALSPFNEMLIYQTCLWLCMNPNILQLANNMNLSMQTPAADGSQFMSPNSTTLTMAPNQDDKLNATNMDELHAHNSIYHLCKFVQSAFAVNYASRDTEGTKALDKLIKSIAVPSRNGKNFTSNIKL
ncbi:10438_t:CDS:2 [Dentiscutata erythropus]|uniref:10438_t:CDS:1 n=1 Tax=Dentiscutata erythropus TaxID=1348616 RepID=A0A9N9ISW2_9GLOM|nr:10438_t:CDS:2 [Dentiscutata erythropus]